ncbi:twitching motility protein PilJ [Marinicella litoralis]|uniref:Twitching motility protein PilJ n=1 Tax=Marinicella litoralis TaxID=644220 RepID=A0A4R6XJ45_9GAMM|nr:methyl-accepting chemotaxis protein [Marinicella litoralis]TDR19525.1 twitching motility protein PilJ [Marinicella litoralis]
MSSSAVDMDQRTRTLPLWQLMVLVILVLSFFGHSYWLATIEQDRTSHLSETDKVQIKAQQLAQYAKQASSGDIDAFEELITDRRIIDDTIKSLKNGNSNYPALPSDVNPRLGSLADRWEKMNNDALTIIEQRDRIEELSDISDKFASEIPILQASSDAVVKRLVAIREDRGLIYLASQQLVLADRMLRRMSEILKGGAASIQASDSLDRDARKFNEVMTGMFNGNDTIKAVTDDQAVESLGRVYAAFDSVQADIGTVRGAMELFDAQIAAADIEVDVDSFVEDAEQLRNQISERTQLVPSERMGWVIAGLSFLWLLWIFRTLSKNDRVRAAVAQDQNERNQQAILRLLDEMGSLADGDLTVNATVSEDITGAIADSVNFAIEALRSLVKTINDASVGVASAAQEAQATAMHLAEASEHQATQITNASAAINEIAVSIDEVSKNSLESADVAQRSVLIAHNGAEVVRDTIKGMNNIRTQIQDTSKRIKRLGESSQEIGNIVELINDIAEQTNILALNAAIQAASSGESGRGFAVVADEVQQLAERASSATRQIEGIVKTIQTDTNEAVRSMEQTTSEVVGGARKAEDAGEALTEIETVSNDLAELIQNISEAARQQSVAATNISGTMNVIQEITTQTSAGTQQTAESIGNLVELATELRKSVEDFKLPDDEFF